ncbi:MAG: class I SAM-dependent methyltransferase [Magnetococcales bacterium]|nr:class I SAM-dependent methyltransferase [Magnetococcales bacterium]
MASCRLCGNNRGNHSFQAREMMFGLRESFLYEECAACHSLFIVEVPADLGRYYGQDYYSHNPVNPAALNAFPERVKRFLRRQRLLAGYPDSRPWQRLAAALFGPSPLWSWLRPYAVRPEQRVADIGSGSGNLLIRLYQSGFDHLTGIDPYVAQPWSWKTLRVLDTPLDQVREPFDFLMMHHSLEHLADPLQLLGEANRCLHKGAYLLVRLPLAGSLAWRTYGSNWVQLDAPRHLCLPTEAAMRSLAQRAGFAVREVFYDSTAFQFWGSVQYEWDIPLLDPRSRQKNPLGDLFSAEQIEQFEALATESNRVGDGDQACFYLEKREDCLER